MINPPIDMSATMDSTPASTAPSILDRIAGTPSWAGLSAYDRALLACDWLTQAGEPIPMWTRLRDLIGKGSPQDINRAKSDFRKALAQRLQDYQAVPTGIPATLAPLLATLWEKAIAQASQGFQTQEAAYQKLLIEQREQTHALIEENQSLETKQTLLEAEGLRLQQQIDALKEAGKALQLQLDTEREGRAQAEAMFAQARADALSLQADMQQALTRFEQVENMALMRIHEAREEATQALAKEALRYEKLKQNSSATFAGLRTKLADVIAREDQLRAESDAWLAERDVLRERLARAEKQVDTLVKPLAAPATKLVVGRRLIRGR